MIEPDEARKLMFEDLEDITSSKIKEASKKGKRRVVIENVSENMTDKGIEIFIKYMEDFGYMINYEEPDLHISWA